MDVVLIVILFLAFAGIALLCRPKDRGDHPRAWAAGHNCVLLACERRRLWPFLGGARNGRVYRVTVQFANGTVQDGWLRCRAGLFGASVSVRSDSAPTPSVHLPGFPVIVSDQNGSDANEAGT